MDKTRIEELVRECYDFNANCSIARLNAVITTAVREAYEEAAKIADADDDAMTMTVGERIRKLGEGL